MLALEIVFWLCAALIVWTQVGYAATLALIARAHGAPREGAAGGYAGAGALPSLSLIVAAHDEEAVIEEKVANALALDYPRELLEVIVACDGCGDATAARARGAGADVVLELPRGGKIRAQDAGVERSRGEIVAFSDANSLWEPDAARALVGAFADPRVGYACGRVTFVQTVPGGGNQEGVYWRYELAVRELESRLSSITAGNGAIYATRRASYIVVDPIMGHDLSLPFKIVQRGLRAVYEPAARASEKMVPSLRGEFARKRRMMSHTWPIVLRGGMLVAALLPAGLRCDDRLAPPAALLHARPARHRAGGERGARGRRRRFPLRRDARAAGGAARRGRSRRRASRPPAADRPLLRAHDRLAGRRPVGLAAPRHRGLLGGGRGHSLRAVMQLSAS